MESLGSKAFFSDELSFEDDLQAPLGSRVFFNGVPDYEDFDSTLLDDLNNHFNGKGELDFGMEEPSPEPVATTKSAQLLTKKRKSQAWDSKPLENRRKSHNFAAKPLDSRRKTMYCTTTSKQPVPFPAQKSITDEHSRFENNAYYSEGTSNPNRRSDFDSPPPRHDLYSSNSVEIEEPLPYFYDEHMNDYAPPLYDLANLFIDPQREEMKSVSKIMMKRRKSEDWDSRPLENGAEGDQSFELEAKARFYDEIDKTKHPDIYPANVKKQEQNDTNGYHRSPASYQASQSRYDSKPGNRANGTGAQGAEIYRSGSLNGNNGTSSTAKFEERACPNIKGSIDFDVTEQRRTKWTSEEVHTLWRGILEHGNNWSIIKDSLPTRTYYQIKDKGRRILYNRGWKTGRTKKDSGGASDDAKVIAEGILQGR